MKDGYAAPNVTTIEQRLVGNVRQGTLPIPSCCDGSVTHALVGSGSAPAGLLEKFLSRP